MLLRFDDYVFKGRFRRTQFSYLGVASDIHHGHGIPTTAPIYKYKLDQDIVNDLS